MLRLEIITPSSSKKLIINKKKQFYSSMTNLESSGVLEFPKTLESKLNIETMSPSCDSLIPSEWELGRK